ncbi:MAG: helix-turn-helix domain-containing protein [Bacteroidetes bacterium]|nr:helix-turn-helix domain-containing protein [Bacteroidota bacterium]
MKGEELYKRVGLKIREIRTLKGMSLQSFSDHLNIEYSNAIRIEKGRTNPTLGTLYKICQILEIKLVDIFEVE